ncbi:MAG: hypothetical protein CL840_14760 [Crocinitomicaceae bacterium]|nr:hypothetical protein [Crocinitomicaceae bacterium]|tara:strand:- start:36633 stop:37226 length:594 start_codon:yes stop_codon:yes gene_type:complete
MKFTYTAFLFLICFTQLIVACNSDGGNAEIKSNGSESSKYQTVKKHFDSGVLKSEHVYNEDKLLYFNEYDSTGQLVDFDRLVDIRFQKKGPVLDAFIKLHGHLHPGRDSILFQISNPSLENKPSHETHFYLIYGDRFGNYQYSWNVEADSIYYLKYDMAEFNYAGSKIDVENAFIINYEEKTIRVDCRKRPIIWEYF